MKNLHLAKSPKIKPKEEQVGMSPNSMGADEDSFIKISTDTLPSKKF